MDLMDEDVIKDRSQIKVVVQESTAASINMPATSTLSCNGKLTLHACICIYL